MGGPKALRHDSRGVSWLRRSVAALVAGGCDRVVVVLGAGADDAERLLADAEVSAVRAADWETGMAASLRAGIGVLTQEDAALISLVDLPDVGSAVIARVRVAATSDRVLARAAYAAVPGHPVLLGRRHWPGVLGAAVGDSGARDYLAGCEVELIECGDLATGRDVDSVADGGVDIRSGADPHPRK
jgi:CTP:molybdopterin cytidylyltransferase MocA